MGETGLPVQWPRFQKPLGCGLQAAGRPLGSVPTLPWGCSQSGSCFPHSKRGQRARELMGKMEATAFL